MSTVLPVNSALEPGTQRSPALTPAQIDRLRPGAKHRKVEPGEILFSPGDMGVPFFVFLSGGMEIVQPSVTGERLITRHHGSGFTGELSMISGQKCLVLGRVTEAGEVLELSPEGLRTVVARDAELSEIIMRAFILRRLELINQNMGIVVLLGSRYSADTLHLREFLVRNGQPYNYVDLDTDKQAQELLDRFAVKQDEIPVVVCSNTGNVYRNPTIQKLADGLGLNASVDSTTVRDLIIVGAGPAGLAAAVYAASEGLDALVIETESPGGQAGSSSKIENYLGFPYGVSGQELTQRAFTQAQKFGAKMMVAHSVQKLICDRRPYQLLLDDGNTLSARSIVIATGAQYKRPEIRNLRQFEGQGIYYGATYMEAQLCQGDDVVVVGGGNSAGQAAVYLAQSARKVYMLVRSGGLAETMSRYLIQRIDENPKIQLLCKTEIVDLDGDDKHLKQVTWVDKKTGEKSTHDIAHVFIMAGASPRTDWLRGCLVMDEKGFILTGRDLSAANGASNGGVPSWQWPLTRAPQMLETSLPGVFAVGDVRAGNVKRVASAVGEGAISIHLVHQSLAES
jgi:thioredoxin reductase (NADPH)